MALLQLLMSAGAALATPADAVAGCSIHYAVPSTLAADSAAATPVTLIGVGFSSAGPGGNVSCHVRGGLFGPVEYQVAQFVQGRVVNDTAMQCDIPPYGSWSGGVSLDVIVDTKLNNNESWSSGTNASLRYRNMVDVDLAKRPFMNNESAMLLLEPHERDIAAVFGQHFPRVVQICASIAGGPPNHECSQHSVAGGARLVPLGLPVPASGDAELLLKVSLSPANVRLSVKRRRWLTASAPTGGAGSFVQVDHVRKLMRVNGQPFLSVGFYVGSISTYLAGATALDQVIADLQGLASVGAGNHHMMYGMEELNDTDLARVVSVCEERGIMFDWPLVEHVVGLLNTSPGQCCNHRTLESCKCGTSPRGWPTGACAKGAVCEDHSVKWTALLASAERVRNSSALLGWYVCDDCVDPEFNKTGLAQIYTQLKRWDPAHLIFGADWSRPWSGWAWSDSSAQGLGFDVAQVENYRVDASDLLQDAENRQGMRWAALINSPPMYLLDPLQNVTNSKIMGRPCCSCAAHPGQPPPLPSCCAQCNPYPAVSEATQAWLSTILYDAPAQMNFIWESPPMNHSVDPLTGSKWSHASAQGEFGALATQMVQQGILLPDVTMNDTALLVEVASGNVLAKGMRRSESLAPGFCSYVIVANLGLSATTYSLRITELPKEVTWATNVFRATNNVSVSAAGELHGRLVGYGSAVLRLGECKSA